MGGIRHLLLSAALALACASASAQIAFRAASQGSSIGASAVSFVASANTIVNSTSIAVARPAGAQQDDILIAQVTVKGVRVVTPPLPAGSWNLINQTSTSTVGDQVTQAVYWRRVGVIGSEPATYTFTWVGSDRATGAITAYRGINPLLNPIDASGVQATNASSTITLPTITTTTANAMLVALLSSSRATNLHTVPTGMTVEQYEITSGAGPNGVTASMAEQLQIPPGSTGAKTASTANADDNIAVLVALRGAGGPLNLAVPGGTVAGDIMIASIAVRPCSGASGAACTLTTTAPAGWNPVGTVNQTTGGSFGAQLLVYWREADATDAAGGMTYTWDFAGSPAHTGAVGGILSFSGVDRTSPIVAQAGQATPSASTHAAPSINTGTVTNTMLVSSHAANASGTWTAPGGMTERADVASLTPNNAAGISLEMNHELRAASGATGGRTATLSNPPAGNTGAAHLLALRPAVTVTHYGISVLASTVANCDYAEVTIVGHNPSHAATNVPVGRTVTLTTSTGTGVWQAGLVAGTGTWLPSGLNNGTASYAWPGGESGFTVRLRQSAVTSLSVNLSDGFITEDAAEDPTISFVNSAFRISGGSNAPLSIGTQIAGKSSNVAPGAQNLFLQAIRTDTATGACVSLFPSGSDVSIQVGAQCNNPATCTQNVTLTSSSPSSNTASFVPNGAYPASMNFRFTTANAEAPFTLSYADAGQITLQFRAALPSPPANQFVQGTSNAFVARPFGFAFTGVTHGTLATSPVLAAAGDNFSMTVGAYRWSAADDANNDGIPDAGANLTDNGLTPNFAAGTTVSATGNLPGVATGTVDRASGGSSIAAGEWSGGLASIANWRYSEVGNVFLSATSNNYLGSGADVTGNSGHDGTGAAGGYVGRFRPKHFAVSATGLANRHALGCGGSFSYMNEGLRLSLTLTAQNAQNAITQNYSGTYAKLGLTTFGNWSLGARSGTTNLIPRVDSAIAPVGSWSNGSAAVTIDTAIRRQLALDDPDGPYPGLQFGIAPVDSDGVAMNTLDFDADNNSVNERKNLGVSTEVRFGRLRMENVVGSESLQLPIRMETQYWNGNTFVRNTNDGCSTVSRQNFSLGGYTGNLNACETMVNEAAVTFSGGLATVNLTAPGGANAGTVLVGLNLGNPSGSRCDAIGGAGPAATSAAMSYLLGRWNDGASSESPDIASTRYDDNPAARASFGLFGGQPNNFIYFRENY